MNVIASRHSNVRMSMPEQAGVIRASIVIALHFGHGGP
jgi:hypothetical protein